MSTASLLQTAGEPQAAYVHVPFCRHRCGYCNFTLVAGRDHWIDRYLTALQRELETLESPRAVETRFLGGGTPTHLPARALERLLALIEHWLPLKPGGEFSVEANPSDLLDADRRSTLQHAGVTRLSLGVQSFAQPKLRVLERDHSAAIVREVVAQCRPWLESLSLDLIFGAPGETLEAWRADLRAALELPIDHLSTYGLTFEKGTTFWNRQRRGELPEGDEDLEAEMYLSAIDDLTVQGWEHYEVSSFARPVHRCRHNQVYWSGDDYYGFGPGAASYVNGIRAVNHRSTSRYLQRVMAGQTPVAESEALPPADRARECLVIGLRRLEGWNEPEFEQRTGFTLAGLVGSKLERFVEAGWLERDQGRLRLTRQGLLISDSIFGELLAADLHG